MSIVRSICQPIVRPLTRAIGEAGGGGFSPRQLFVGGVQGAWYDPSDLSTMFQDTAGTVPVTAAGQSVARINDKSGNGRNATQATALNQPTLQQDGNGKYYLDFSGSQFLTVAYTQTAYPLSLAVAAKSDVNAVGGAISVTASTVIYHGVIKTATANSWAATDRNASIVTDGAPVVGDNTTAHVLLGLYNGTAVEARMDGQSNGTTASANAFGSGNALWLGCLRSGSDFLDGRIYQALAINKTLSASEVAGLESFFGRKVGVIL